ncbi:hypothetical protein DN757_07735 [Paenibacillus silvae]|uniref:Histidinol dehydrogenase n=1 Tax=Paenibacillus silvae TaxID=1325358 RepID=A0A2W6PDW3_9BACL|nr:hypothetical protein DN757_07735 [Paenibacillus silvae]
MACDLINEGEHGPDSSSIFVTTSTTLAHQVEALLWKCIDEVEEKRRQYLLNVFGSNGKGAIIIASNIEEAFEFVN